MAETNLSAAMSGAGYSSYHDLFKRFNELSQQYGNLPLNSLMSAFDATMGIFGRSYSANPYVQNRRVKAISSMPKDYGKDQVAKMISSAEDNEQPLRQVEHALEYSAYPLFHTRVTYQNLLTYHNYIAPQLSNEGDSKKDDFWREWKLLEKLRREMDLKSKAHEITGQALQEGKVFYATRVSIDKPHNKVNYAFIQQLPSDWCKIVGFNNKSKYTIAFNMMYFAQFGTSIAQFGDLFEPYITDFYGSLTETPTVVGKRVVYSSKVGIDLQRVNFNQVDAYYNNGRWYYWVTLPVDRVFTFEIDDANRAVISPFVGLFLDMIQLSQLENIQLELLQNPLVSILTGEIPYFDSKDTGAEDQYKLSTAGRELFMQYWYQMIDATGTGGIGLYAAPFQNMKLHNLAEAPNATNIVSQGYSDTMAKAGLSAIIPTVADARAGAVQVSFLMESKFAQTIYRCFERMMNTTIETLKPKYDWRCTFFGDLATDEKLREELKQSMTLGILPATIMYDAMNDMSILDDISLSDAVMNSKLLDRRIPLISSYTAKQGESGLPPKGEDKGGRPESEDAGSSDGHEQDEDSPVERNPFGGGVDA